MWHLWVWCALGLGCGMRGGGVVWLWVHGVFGLKFVECDVICVYVVCIHNGMCGVWHMWAGCDVCYRHADDCVYWLVIRGRSGV